MSNGSNIAQASVATIQESLRRGDDQDAMLAGDGISRHDSGELEAERKKEGGGGAGNASVATIQESLRRAYNALRCRAVIKASVATIQESLRR